MSLRSTGLAVFVVLAAATSRALAGPGSDACSTATAITGTGTFAFDTSSATTGVEGQTTCNFGPAPTIANDVWFCWTAPCTGLVIVETCNLTALDTRIAMYAGCSCPPGSAGIQCCNDDACGIQSSLSCEVIECEQYLIQIGQFPDGLAGGTGSFLISYASPCVGKPCAGGCVEAEGQCCAGRPSFKSTTYSASFTAQVAVVTASPDLPTSFPLEIVDLANLPPIPPPGDVGPLRYSDPSWTAANLGSIFGLALDTAGNIYTTATRVYFSDTTGAAGTGSFGDIYRIDGVTGAISVFATLPQSTTPPGGPGLGNITYDCANDQFFVTNFEDGRIYRLDAGGSCLSTFDHATATVGGCGTEVGDAAGFAPLGERPWGVEVHGGRVYYGLWWEHSGSFSVNTANEVWSVGLDGTGEFDPPTQLEVSLPQVVNPVLNPGNLPYSMPVSDIRFSESGRMMLAEHGMFDDSSPSPHQSRLLEYACLMGTWVPGNTFTIGVSHPEGNSAGGVDIDYDPSGRVWVTGDALQFGPQYVYGIQGLPATGGNVTNSYIIDYNGNVGSFVDKNKIGDVDVPCVRPCALITDEHLDCATDGSGDVIYTFTITNLSGTAAQWLLVPSVATVPNNGSVTLSPNVIPLVPPLQGDGSNSQTIQLVISGGQPGQEVCFLMSLADAKIQECCGLEVCVTLPECDCLVTSNKEITDVVCLPDGTVTFDFSFTLTNLSGDVIEYAFLIPQTPGITFNPDDFDLPSVPNLGTVNLSTSVSGAQPGQVVCFDLTIHDATLNQCCAIKQCIIVPECDPPFGGCIFCNGTCFSATQAECEAQGGYYCGDGTNCATCVPPNGACCRPDGTCFESNVCECPPPVGTFFPGVLCADAHCLAPAACAGDCNGDGVVDVLDLVSVVLEWGTCPAPCPADLDDSGIVDVSDMVAVILNWGQCP